MTRDRLDAPPGGAWFATIASAVAFALHYAWENAQCSAFYVHVSENPMQLDMVLATLGDVVMTWIAFAAAALVTGSWHWPFGRWDRRVWGALVGAAFVMSVAVERFAVTSGRWSYTAINPLIPGTGVSILPVAQLVVLFPLTFWLAIRISRATRSPSRGM